MRFQLQLDLKSLVMLCAISGVCFSIVGIPLLLLISIVIGGAHLPGIHEISIALMIGPLAGLAYGTLTGFVAYPAYQWLLRRFPVTFSGQVRIKQD